MSLADTPTPRLGCRSSSHDAASPLSLTRLLLCAEEYEGGGWGSAGGARYGERHTSPYRALRPWTPAAAIHRARARLAHCAWPPVADHRAAIAVRSPVSPPPHGYLSPSPSQRTARPPCA
ncbi:hypothetical protein [Oryza sativa Japonica Group]|uniref:Uncharacterized protein n=1 Tax=Oryza sativa subsp. japonica TaxID=39947 RepID=Q5ZA16_ORYSJ|nr:hypothetical protein [Oryza sativa Japonica Group]